MNTEIRLELAKAQYWNDSKEGQRDLRGEVRFVFF